MDIVSEKSPSSSPPISPIKFTTHATAHHCSPPSNFPNWTRASFERAKLVKAIPRDNKERKVVLVSNSLSSTATQTEGQANSSSLTEHDAFINKQLLEYKNALVIEQRKLANVEKNFKFVVLHHEDVMKRLHREVSELKDENKDLNFRLVMTEGQVSSVQSAFSDEHGRLQCSRCKGSLTGQKPMSDTINSKEHLTSNTTLRSRNSMSEQGEKLLEVKVNLLKEEITKLKTALKDAKMKNSKLTQLVEQRHQPVDLNNESLLSNYMPEPPILPKVIPSPEKHRPGNFGHQPLDRIPRGQQLQQHRYNHQQQSSQYGEVPLRDDVIADRRGSIAPHELEEESRAQLMDQLDMLHSRQEHEMSQMNELLLKQRLRPFENQIRVEEKLPPISLDASVRPDRNMKLSRKPDPIALPILIPAPPSNRNLSDRQKRAKVLHVQRQRNNREFTSLL